MKKRIELLDAWRGFALLGMIMHHVIFDLEEMFNKNAGFFSRPWINVSAAFFWTQFMLIAGISSRLSRSNLKRGLFVLACAMALTIITVIFFPGDEIYFGILHFMGCAMIFYALTGKYWTKLKNIQPFLYIALFLIFCLLTMNFNTQKLSFDYKSFTVPYLFAFGFPTSLFISADYFPLLPWIFIYLSGAWIGGIIKEKELPDWFYARVPVLSFMGKRSLLIYFLHQPVVYIILLIIIKWR